MSSVARLAYKPATARYHRLVEDFKRQLLEAELRRYHGSRTQTARALEIPRTYLQKIIKDLGVQA
jgi:DNA-binding NtrC family response regulator